MTAIIDYHIDEVELATILASADSWTHLKLYYANTPDMTPADTGVSVALDSLTYEYELEYTSGNKSQWFRVVLYNGVTTSSLVEAPWIHGQGGTNLTTLRRRVGEVTGDLIAESTTGAGAVDGSTVVCNDPEVTRFEDGHFIGWYVYLPDTGDWSQVSNSVGQTLTVSPAFSAQVADATNFELMKRWTPKQYRDAINRAIINAYPQLSRSIISTALRTVADTYVYTQPADMISLSSVEVETDEDLAVGTADRGYPWRQVPFERLHNGIQRQFELRAPLPEDRRLRLMGQGLFNQVYADSDWVEVGFPEAEIIVYGAAHHLFQLLITTSAATDRDFYKEMAGMFLAMQKEYSGPLGTGRKAKRMWSAASQSNVRTRAY